MLCILHLILLFFTALHGSCSYMLVKVVSSHIYSKALCTYFWSSPFCEDKTSGVLPIAANIFLNLDSQTKVCSAAMVLKSGWFNFKLSGEYSSLHLLSMWFRICRLSMIFWILIHILSNGAGSGSRCLAAFRPSKWHMLS